MEVSMYKKVMAVMLSLVLVICTLNYVPYMAKASQSDAENYDWGTVEYLVTSGVPQYANQYKMVLISGNASIDVIQNPGWAAKPGVYVTFGDADFGTVIVNDAETTDYTQQGAGIIFHMTAFAQGGNDLVVKDAGGNVKAEFYVYNYSSGESETTSEETTTKEPETIPSGQPGSSDIAAPTDVSAYNFYARNQGYQFLFTEVEGAVSYNIYIDNVEGAIASVTASKQYVSADVFSAFSNNELHTVYVAAVDNSGNVSVKSEGARLRMTAMTDSASDPTDISRIYVVTNGGAKGGSTITKADKTPASLTIISGDGVVKTVSDGGTIKLRGNSTSLADKPAYNISFSSKKEVLTGSEKGKKWCLLANAFDKSLMRSKLAMDLGNELGSIASPDQAYADLYIDGEFKGSYLISEPAENGRVGIDYDDSDASNEMMFELEVDRVEEGQTYYTSGMGLRFVTADPEGLDPATDRYNSWISSLAAFENALRNTSSDEVFNYIDVDSFVDMYIVNELFQTIDFGYSSVKFYIQNNESGAPIIYAGPLWDFDLSSGNSSFVENRTIEKFRGQEVNLWFNYLMKNETFKNKVVQKFETMQPQIQNIYKDNALGKSQINQIQENFYESRVRNYTAKSEGGAGWSESVVDSAELKYYPYSYGTVAPYNTYTYDQHVEYLENWLKSKNEWICTQWGIDYSAYDSEYNDGQIKISSDIDVTGYQMSSTFNGVDGSMGFRVIYQAEPTVEKQTAEEIGLVYGLAYGDNPIAKEDLVCGSQSEYVKSYAATSQGKLSTIMGDSKTATYYVRTMSCGVTDGSENISKEAYTSTYYVRAYAKLADGSYVYSNVAAYTVYGISDYIYQNNLAPRKSTYDYLYSKILKVVNPDYVEGDFDWSIIVGKTVE